MSNDPYSSMSGNENQSSVDDGGEQDRQKMADRTWNLPPFRDQMRGAGLYLVATPIGNLNDISVRALDTLAGVDIILCEDTRVSSVLLRHYGLHVTLEAYHDHSGDQQRDSIIRRIVDDGVRFALISDAGMPMVCDPGYKLVRDLIKAGGYVTSIPGASAPLTALQLSGQVSDSFSFIGFLPSKEKARQAYLEKWADVPGSLIAFETSSRLKAALADIASVLGGERDVSVMRELTKKFEEGRMGAPLSLLEYYETQGSPKGEIVLVISPAVPKTYGEDDIKQMLGEALTRLRTKDAAAEVADKTGLSRKELYAIAVQLSSEGKNDG